MGGAAGGFTGIFEIVAVDKARVGRVKRRPLCEPYLTLGTLAAPIYLATLPAQGREGGGERWSTTGSSLTIPNLIPRVSRFRR